jgi:hypothetical protein
MSTQTWDEAARLLSANVLVDEVQIMDVGQPVTVGAEVTRALTPSGQPVKAWVQSVTLENAVESRTSQTYSIKVARDTALVAGQAIKVLNSRHDADLVGMVLLVDKITKNSRALIRKGTASNFETIDQQGKEGLA